jgi:periplasmic protein TonB
VVGSLIVNGVIVALLFAIAPRRFERQPTVLVDVAIAPTVPTPAVPVIAPVAAPSSTPTPAGRPRRAAAPPPSPSAAPDDAVAGAGGNDASGSDGDDGNGGTGGGSGNGLGIAVARAPTMPIPIGARNAQLPYTREALVAHTEGIVLVRLIVGADGKVAKSTLTRGLGHGLDAIALALAAKLEFQPARDTLGQPITAQITWRFHFTPPPDAAAL